MRVIFTVLCLVALAACASGSDRMDRRGNISPRNLPDERPERNLLNPAQAYTQAMDQKAAGNCDQAAPMLKRLADRGPGYENAQLALGQCLMTLAEDNDTDRLAALVWTRRAADGGWPEAQVDLVVLYGNDPLFQDLEDALYWLAVYDNNPRKARIGYSPPPEGLLEAVRARATDAQWAGAQQKAISFVETPYIGLRRTQAESEDADMMIPGEGGPPQVQRGERRRRADEAEATSQ